VIAWLGTDKEGVAGSAFALARQIARHEHPLIPRKSTDIKSRSTVPDDLEWYALVEYADTSGITAMDPEERSRWTALANIYRRLWFTRVWVIQEVGMASSAVMKCGEAEISWEELKDAAGCMDDRAHVFVTFFGLEAEVQRCFDLYWLFSAAGSNQTFVETLYEAKSFISSNPKDKVYALLAHPSAQPRHGMTIELDYDCPMAEWYIRLASKILVSTDSLQFLSAVQHMTNESVHQAIMPSWVPQWSEKPWSYMLWHTVRHETYRTAAYTMPDFEVTIADGLLKVQGILFDHVTAIGEMISSQDYTSQGGVSFAPFKGLEKLLNIGGASSRKIYPSDEAWKRATFMTLTAGMFMGGQKQFESYLEWLSDGCKSDTKETDATLFKTTAGLWSDKRRPFLASKGYIGLGPSVLQKDDVVVVLFGCMVPFILRPQGGEYRLVGEAYVHGIMKGEAIEMWREGKLSQQTFCLR
jgi:hypothetical protein